MNRSESHLAEWNEQVSEYGLIIKNADVLIENEIHREDLPILPHGKIATSTAKLNRNKALQLDASNMLVLSGAIDVHVHSRDGKQAYKEDWRSLSKAALAGGMTTAFGMPNTNPITDTVDRLRRRFGLAREKSLINYAEYIGTLGKNERAILDDQVQERASGVKIYLNETTGSFAINVQEALKLASHIHPQANQLTFVLHAEGKTLQSIALPLLKLGHRVHVAHISLASEVALVEELRKKGFPITAEVTPHHLLISIEEVREKVRKDLCEICVMKPPLSPKEDLEALHHGIESGAIIAIATDHAPHTLGEKQLGAEKKKPVYGVPGVQEMLPLMLTHLQATRGLPEINRLTSSSPAHHFGIRSRGQIKSNFWADLTIINPHREYQIGDADHPIHSKAGWSTYAGWPVKGEISSTIVNGKIAYLLGEQAFDDQSHARRIQFDRD